MDRNQRMVLVASILGSFVAFLDMAVVNVALPAIRRELGGGLSSQEWIVDAYLLTLGSTILIAGSLSDLFGRKRVFAAGLVGFAATSLLCTFAPSAPVLIGARALQGLAGALLVPSSLALVMATFSGPAQAQAVGTWTAWTGVASMAGPLLGGALVDAGSWRWVFAINVVPIAATLIALARIAPEPPAPRRGPIDAAGALLGGVGLGGIMFALIEQPQRGWANPGIILGLAVGGAALVGFFVRERTARRPMLDFGLFRHRNFAAGNLATVAIYAALSAAIFLITVFLQQVAGYSAVRAGLALIPVTVLMFALSPLFGRLAGKLGPRAFMTFGPLTAGAGFALMTRFNAHGDYARDLLPGVLVLGLGMAATVAPLTAATLGSVDQEHAGVGSAINNAIARIAGLLGIAALGAFLAVRFTAAVDDASAAAPHRLNPAAAAHLAGARSRPLETSIPAQLAAERPVLQPILEAASVRAFHGALWSIAGLLATGGVISGLGIRNPEA